MKLLYLLLTGLMPSLLRSLLLRGYQTPTPIQRAAIPSILALPSRDLVGMARTGSGKTLAYIVPLIHKLNGRHSASFGIKSLILCPGRELALQILKVGKDLSRGCKSEDGEPIRWAMIVGGESMDEQFALMANNPDVVIATPGRLLHLAVEMDLDLSAVHYAVFDEADRLFEMGFAPQLEELLKRLPVNRQTCLFSATLPKSLVDFARAGLGANPKLVRLDAESKVSSELRMGFFSIKPADKEAALLVLLRDVIGVPFGEQNAASDEQAHHNNNDKKRKRWVGKGSRNSGAPGGISGIDNLLPHQTIIFCATKHHVEYLLALLTHIGYACSHIYSSLDQAARSLEMKRFREGRTSLLVVTDVAARGIDLPVLEHVVNYDFTPSPRVFVHRVGRTARAGKSGWAWSLITNKDLAALCDLQLFLNRPLVPPTQSTADDASSPLDAHTSLHLGTFPRDALDVENEYLTSTLPSIDMNTTDQLSALKKVVARAQKMYERSNGAKASAQSFKRARKMMESEDGGGEGEMWKLAGSGKEEGGVSDFFRRPQAYGLLGSGPTARGSETSGTSVAAATAANGRDNAEARSALLAKIANFKPSETVFEIGSKGEDTPLARLMKDRRKTLQGKQIKRQVAKLQAQAEDGCGSDEDEADGVDDMASDVDEEDAASVEQAGEDEIKSVFDTTAASSSSVRNSKTGSSSSSAPRKSFKDPSFYMGYEQSDAATERGYSLGSSGTTDFNSQARSATFSLTGDDKDKFGTSSQAPNAARWDTKKKKFIKGDGVGSDNQKFIRTESGTRLPASFKSGRFDEWKKKHRVEFGSVGQQEEQQQQRSNHNRGGNGDGSKKYRHHSTKEGKRLDPLASDYDKKLKARKMKAGEGVKLGKDGRDHSGQAQSQARALRAGGRGRGRGGKKSGAYTASSRNELKSSRDIAKERIQKEQRREKNARPSARGRGGGGGRGRGGRGGGRGGRR